MALTQAIYRRMTLPIFLIFRLLFWNAFTRNQSAFDWQRKGAMLAVHQRSEPKPPNQSFHRTSRQRRSSGEFSR